MKVIYLIPACRPLVVRTIHAIILSAHFYINHQMAWPYYMVSHNSAATRVRLTITILNFLFRLLIGKTTKNGEQYEGTHCNVLTLLVLFQFSDAIHCTYDQFICRRHDNG